MWRVKRAARCESVWPLVLISALLATQGCTVAGYTAGAVLDRNNDRTIPVATCATLDSLRGRYVRLELRNGRDVEGRLTGKPCCESGIVRLETGGGPGTVDVAAIEVSRVQAVIVRQGRLRGTYALIGFGLDLAAALFFVAAVSGFGAGL